MNRRDLIASLCRLLRASEIDVTKLVLTAPYQYKHYRIPKRTGGMRDIFHPTPGLKAAQRWLVAEVLSELRVHPAVYSYVCGIGIRQHAEQHIHSNFLFRLDFSDFFPSIDLAWLEEFLLAEVQAGRLAVEPDVVPLLLRLVCRFSKADRTLALSIGAPSSPALSNAILFGIDDAAHRRCTALDCIYTRYADDLYVSTRHRGVLLTAELELRAIISKLAPKLNVNERKTANVSKKTKRIVTGLTLTPDRRVSVGRDMKRAIKTQVYLSINGQLSPEDTDRLCGLVAFVRDVEPAFFAALVVKFGDDVLERLLRRRLQGKVVQGESH